MHTCPYPGCDVRCRDEMFACRPHWFSLPDRLRADVWTAYRRKGVGSPELREAHAAAMNWWERAPDATPPR